MAPSNPPQPLPPGPHFGDPFLREQLLDRRRRLEAPGLAEREDVRALIRDVDAALARFERGEFGICESCHDSIEAERVIADPLVRVCLGCLSPVEARALEHDLELAAAVQTALLPKDALELDGWQIHYCYHPLGPVSGDHCDVVQPAAPGGPAHFVFGDVSGKGVAASILMSHLHAIFRSLLPQGLPLVDVMRHANRLFSESTLPSSHATLVAGRLEPTGRLELSNAGHVPPLLVRRGQITPLASHGLPLGLFSSTSYGASGIELDPGDLLLLYTDGLSETRNAAGELYGEARLGRVLGGLGGAAPAEVLRACLADLDGFRESEPREDDLTVMAIRRMGPAGGSYQASRV